MNPEENTKVKKEGTVGPIIGTIIVIIILLIGAWYFLANNLMVNNQKEDPKLQKNGVDQTLEEEVVRFDEFEDINQDLDQIQADIEAELNN